MPTDSNQRAIEAQERRREFLDDLPQHYCPNCTALVYPAELDCFHCKSPAGQGWMPIAAADDKWLGRVLAERYLVTRRIARSSRASVYVADSRIIPRSFAVKIMNVSGGPNLDEAGLRARLQREVEALGTLRNPHIVSFYDVFDVGARHVGLVTDFIEGTTLDDLVSDGPLDIDRALEISRQLANGLYEAHMRGLIHRDLKPPNVMIEQLPSGDDFVRILDFGVMWVRGTATNTGAFDSVPVYTSPEQIMNEQLDQRSDLYSLGALMFLMMTGRPPFTDEEMTNPAVVIGGAAPALEDVTGQEFPAQVEAIVSRLLAKDPDQRPMDVSDVLAWIEEILAEGSHASEAYESEAYESDEYEDIPSEFSPAGTAMGMVPTLGDASSPVLVVQPSELSAVSEAALVDHGPPPDLVACRGGGYAWVKEGVVTWGGTFSGESKLVANHEYITMAVSEKRVILGTADGCVVLAEPGKDAFVAFQDPRLAPMSAVAVIADGTSMIAGSQSGRMYMNRGTDFVRMGGSNEAIGCLCLSETGDQFGVARANSIQVLSLGASNVSSFPAPLRETVVSMAFSPDAYLIAILAEGGTVVLESVHTGQEFMRLDTGDENLRSLTFSPENHLMGLFVEHGNVVLRKLT